MGLEDKIVPIRPTLNLRNLSPEILDEMTDFVYSRGQSRMPTEDKLWILNGEYAEVLGVPIARRLVEKYNIPTDRVLVLFQNMDQYRIKHPHVADETDVIADSYAKVHGYGKIAA